ncbi:aromatic-ring-hydroxylating dioxygenase subunit beta [Streptomyces sp. NBC_00075]|uniref:aromatic-ring-hydroxylating dioxygenase subunit beta n=1 Tax=Streptomyces sp. NBC_00075 TaxID=2975641 RepID=UPI00324753D4
MTVDRPEIEDFLFQEAELLDNWQLHEWGALFTDDGSYFVHGTNVPVTASPESALFYIADDQIHIRERVSRLYKRLAIAEYPHSRTRHFVSNVRVAPGDEDEIAATCNLVVHRWRDRADAFFGVARYRLVKSPEGFKIREKRCVIDCDNLQSQSRISIIL